MIKPLYGFLSDAVPLFGYRRCSYLALCGLLGAASWGGLATVATSPTAVVALLLLGSASTACADVVADSVVVQIVQRPGSKAVRACVHACSSGCCACCDCLPCHAAQPALGGGVGSLPPPEPFPSACACRVWIAGNRGVAAEPVLGLRLCGGNRKRLLQASKRCWVGGC